MPSIWLGGWGVDCIGMRNFVSTKRPLNVLCRLCEEGEELPHHLPIDDFTSTDSPTVPSGPPDVSHTEDGGIHKPGSGFTVSFSAQS